MDIFHRPTYKLNKNLSQDQNLALKCLLESNRFGGWNIVDVIAALIGSDDLTTEHLKAINDCLHEKQSWEILKLQKMYEIPLPKPVEVIPGNQNYQTRIGEGFVYFIQGQKSKKVKIGYSSDPKKRMKTLQTGCPEPLMLLGMIPARPNEERVLHDRFSPLKASGEWFNLKGELLSYMESIGIKLK